MIYYILEKEKSKADLLSRKNNFIKIKEILNYSILKIIEDKLLSVNKHELGIIIYIIRDNQKQFLIKKRRFYIFENKINRIIKDYQNKLL